MARQSSRLATIESVSVMRHPVAGTDHGYAIMRAARHFYGTRGRRDGRRGSVYKDVTQSNGSLEPRILKILNMALLVPPGDRGSTLVEGTEADVQQQLGHSEESSGSHAYRRSWRQMFPDMGRLLGWYDTLQRHPPSAYWRWFLFVLSLILLDRTVGGIIGNAAYGWLTTDLADL